MLNPEKPLSAAQEKRLRQWFPDMPRLRGYLTAIAWSPGVVVPSKWITPLMELLHAAQDSGAKKAPTLAVMNSVLGDLMQLYNQLNGMVLTHDLERLPRCVAFASRCVPLGGRFRPSGGVVRRPMARRRRCGQERPDAIQGPVCACRAGPGRSRCLAPTDGDGQPVLTGISADPPPPIDLLTHALLPL